VIRCLYSLSVFAVYIGDLSFDPAQTPRRPPACRLSRRPPSARMGKIKLSLPATLHPGRMEAHPTRSARLQFISVCHIFHLVAVAARALCETTHMRSRRLHAPAQKNCAPCMPLPLPPARRHLFIRVYPSS